MAPLLCYAVLGDRPTHPIWHLYDTFTVGKVSLSVAVPQQLLRESSNQLSVKFR